MQEKFTFFWNGPFSQWSKSTFAINGIVYNCAEQYMMAQKALIFRDQEIYDLIMKSDSPREQKKLGRKVRNFVESTWDKESWRVVYRGNKEKFRQNFDLYCLLKDTAGTTIVEASPYDTIWGIGLDKEDPLAQERKTWKGQNRLGQILTSLRDEFYALNEFGKEYHAEQKRKGNIVYA